MSSVNDIAGRAKPFLERIENLETEKQILKDACKEQCAPLNDDIKEVYEEAEGAGIEKKALAAIVKQRKLKKKIEAIGEGFDLAAAAQFDALALAFGENTPFGDHARERANAIRAAGIISDVSVSPARMPDGGAGDVVDELAR